MIYVSKWVLLNHATISSQLHPSSPSSTQVHPPSHSSSEPLPSSTYLHLVHFSLQPALCNTLNVIRTKILNVVGQFPQIQCSICSENWRTWYIWGSDSKSRLIFLKFRPKIQFWTNLDRKSQSCFFFLENWHKWFVEDGDSYSDISFLNFQPKIIWYIGDSDS